MLFSLVLLLAVSCKEKNTVGNASMLSGADSKTWKTDKETTATGEKDKLTSAEKKKKFSFLRMVLSVCALPRKTLRANGRTMPWPKNCRCNL